MGKVQQIEAMIRQTELQIEQASKNLVNSMSKGKVDERWSNILRSLERDLEILNEQYIEERLKEIDNETSD